MRPAAHVVTARAYATRPRPAAAPPSLQHFLQRARVLSLYRAIMRSTGRIRDARTRAEARRHARDEFERHRRVDDLGHIRYLVSTGKTHFESVEMYLH